MVIAVIPSRFHSTRFPGKSLALIEGEPLVARVARRVLAAGVADEVLVATDDARIAAAAEAVGCPAHVSRAPFRSGSDRVAEAVRGRQAAQILNVQGDEALVDGEVLRAALEALEGCDLGTVATLAGDDELAGADAVKVALDGQGRARAFSRRRLPGAQLLHLGVYAFERGALERFAALPSSPGEQGEGLEQLRALEQGMTIGVRLVRARHLAVNRPGDLDRLAAAL